MTERKHSPSDTYRVSAEIVAADIARKKAELSELRDELCRWMRTYRREREQLLDRALDERNLSWCTVCHETVPVSDAQLLLREGTKETEDRSFGTYGFEDFSELHRVCPRCLRHAEEKHGFQQGRERFCAFFVQQCPDGIYAHQFGKWVKLPDDQPALPALPKALFERLASAWELPPDIEIFDRDFLVVRDRAKTA